MRGGAPCSSMTSIVCGNKFLKWSQVESCVKVALWVGWSTTKPASGWKAHKFIGLFKFMNNNFKQKSIGWLNVVSQCSFVLFLNWTFILLNKTRLRGDNMKPEIELSDSLTSVNLYDIKYAAKYCDVDEVWLTMNIVSILSNKLKIISWTSTSFFTLISCYKLEWTMEWYTWYCCQFYW